MLHLFLVLSIVLNPKTEIKGLKLKHEQRAPSEGAFLKRADFLLLKNHVESGKCEAGLKSCVDSCNEQIELIMTECTRTPCDINEQILGALEYELEESRLELKKQKQLNKTLLYMSGTVILIGGLIGVVYTL